METAINHLDTNAAEQIKTACGDYVGIAERGLTALACLAQVGTATERALPIVAAQLAGEVEAHVASVRAYWRTAGDYMPNDDAARLSAQRQIAERLRAVIRPKLHPIMAMSVAPFRARA